MKVVYLERTVGLVDNLLGLYKAAQERGESNIVLNGQKLAMPIILNVTPFPLKELGVLGRAFYKWVKEFRTVRNPSEAAIDRFSYRIKGVVRAAKNTGLDIIVLREPGENIDMIRDELKLCIRTK